MTSAIIAGEELELRAECAVYWPRMRTLLIADPHFGKAASFRTLGVYVPPGTTEHALARLDSLIANTEPERLVFLGDFLHAREGRNDQTFAAIAEWRARHSHIRMQIVRGNHDYRAGDPPSAVGIECVDGPLPMPPFCLAHHPISSKSGYVLAGHIHPCAVLLGPAKQRERLPCFSFSESVGILPAFGEFTGCAEVDTADLESCWVIAQDEVVRVLGRV